MAAARLPPMLVVADPGTGLGQEALFAYMEEVLTRYQGRPATPAEMERALREHPSDDLAPPEGLLVVAVAEGKPVGCGGVRLLSDEVAQLTRVYVAPPGRRQGLGARIVRFLERYAAEQGRIRMRLDTRSDLVEARALYERLGFREVPPFNEDPYAQHWFEKTL